MPLPPFSLCYQLFGLLFLPLNLLYPLVMIVHCHTQDLLGPILAHHKLIEMLLQHLRGELRGTMDGGAPKRAYSTSTIPVQLS